MRTEWGTYAFTVKEGAEGRPYVAAEPAGGGVRALDRGLLVLELAPDADIREAEKLAAALRRLVSRVGLSAT